jgi:5-methylthioadenosine/S-adenosylhomocysteine deaminase
MDFVRAIRAHLIWEDEGFRSDRALLVEGDRSRGVVASGSIPPDIEVEDWGDVALLPGTVNAHGHAFQSLLKGYADDRPFPGWRDDVLYPFSERLDRDSIYVGALFAFAEALLAGATTTVDFFYLHDGGNDNARAVLHAAHDAGIRLVFARAFYDSDAPTSAPQRYREKVAEAVANCEELATEYRGDSLISVQPAPHSLHAASPETVAAALALARDLDVPCHLHLAEASYERDQVRDRYGATPVRLLHREGLLDPRLVTIHTLWADDEELDLLAQAGVGVVHCPGANAFLGDGIARVPEMVARGMRVGLGPDGGCANNRQSVFDEMRTATLMAKARMLDGGALDAPTALRLGTVGGADLLQLPVGSLEAGRYADVVALSLLDLSLQPPGNLERLIVSSMQPTAIARVMVGGEVVVEGGHPTGFALEELRVRIAEVTKGWTRP